MEEKLLSFCIATFQRYEILRELVTEILSVNCNKFEIIVCDDCSEDGSIEKIKKIQDSRLKIYINEVNVGSLQNIYQTLEHGTGRYLFYVNDRDNIDKFKIKELIHILEDLEKKDVAFAKCLSASGLEKYQVLEQGKEALLEFACKMDHPTGFILKKDCWKKIKIRKALFTKESYGDYALSQICTILAIHYNGALIYGDICDINRYRIDFRKIKSGYYKKRSDKRLWYTPEIIFREMKIGQNLLEKIKVKSDLKKQILINRYTEYLSWCVTEYKSIIKNPVCTTHYDVCPSQNFIHVFMKSIKNGLSLWSKVMSVFLERDKEICKIISKITVKEYIRFFKNICFPCQIKNRKLDLGYSQKDILIMKQETILNVYEEWIDALLDGDNISEYLLSYDCHNIAIYGMGRLGRNLYNEFQNSEICVKYFIDQNMSKIAKDYEHIPCYNIQSTLPRVDLIIVTVTSEAQNIMTELKRKTGYQINSINNILIAIANR